MYSSVKKDDALRQRTDEIRVGISLRGMNKLAMILFAPEATGILTHVCQHEIPTGSLLVPIRSLYLRAHSADSVYTISISTNQACFFPFFKDIIEM